MSRDIIRQDEDGRLAIAHKIARHGEDEVGVGAVWRSVVRCALGDLQTAYLRARGLSPLGAAEGAGRPRPVRNISKSVTPTPNLEREFPPIWRKPDKCLCKQTRRAAREIRIRSVPLSGGECFGQPFVQALHALASSEPRVVAGRSRRTDPSIAKRMPSASNASIARTRFE
jgi:hypothetical protein